MKFKEAFEYALKHGEEMNKTKSKIIGFLKEECLMVKLSLNEYDLEDEGIHFVDVWTCDLSGNESRGAESYEEFMQIQSPYPELAFPKDLANSMDFIVYTGEEIDKLQGYQQELFLNCY